MSELNEYGRLLLKTLEHLRVVTAMEDYPVSGKLNRLDKIIDLLRADGMKPEYNIEYGQLIYESLREYQRHLRTEPFITRSSEDQRKIEMCDEMITCLPKVYRQ